MPMFNESHDPVLVGKYLTNIIIYADDLVLLSNPKVFRSLTCFFVKNGNSMLTLRKQR